MSAPVEHWSLGTVLQDWFLGGTSLRWRTRRRWLHAGLTVTLLVTGFAAWVVAIVQPWQVRAADLGMVPVKGQPTPDRVRAAALAAQDLVEEPGAADPRPLKRDPFQAARPWGAATGPSEAGCESANDAQPAGSRAVTAEQVVQVAKDLMLKATVHSPTGERWAVINGKTYREGDDVAGLTLVEVQEDRARLQRAGVTCILKMD